MARPGNTEEFREVARRRLPQPLFDYIDGGADDERTLKRNSAVFEKRSLVPHGLVDVSRINCGASILGQQLSMPLILSPTGMSRLFHSGKELAVARAAADAGLLYGLSTMATTSIEDVAAASNGSRMFQIYIFKDRGLTNELVDRCAAAGYHALCLTIDTPLAGNRERDRRSGMTIPPRFDLRSLVSYALHPRWLLDFLKNPDFRLANVVHRVDALASGPTGLIEYVNAQFDPSVTWEDAKLLVRQWKGPFVIKGVLDADDAIRARDIGATAVMISNHGGRQLDGVLAPLETLPEIREAVGDTIELIVDGGVRRGSDIVKAICLGADACSIGRPYLYALAADGENGVRGLLEILRSEFARTLALMGKESVHMLNRGSIV
ncbi:alpha-hydroxy acid oxidase [Novosphingobium taihuense]|uniref:L-lactate dehydrogenase (Cytochrome) n=1 Tax=Novosphingobium taihuense TaxID=260085 RepID=A0A7W7AEZ8_9SPHN|nr:alpha-hydroxy acid oxidase [Novosphingobium taihuense]MBB4615788.1 L-lactate dehydrogenase (cytochrome) [Novosphingobium taihuense]TWH79222.1 L-lactate dehydrogenase (cytochrome) [Novosphingobium taihuense]